MDDEITRAWEKAAIIDDDPEITRADRYGNEIDFYGYNDRSCFYGWVIKDGEAVHWVAAEVKMGVVGFGLG